MRSLRTSTEAFLLCDQCYITQFSGTLALPVLVIYGYRVGDSPLIR
jgi:hypothetical protein